MNERVKPTNLLSMFTVLSAAMPSVKVLVRYACIATSMLPDQKHTYKKMENVFVHSDIYSKLPD